MAIDGRKAVLAKAERLAHARLAAVQKLLAEHQHLKNKEMVLEQIIEGLSTMSQLMALSPSLTGGGKDTLLDEALTSLLDLELQIHQHTCQANAFTANSSTSQDSNRSSCSPYCLVFLHKVFNQEYAKEVMAMTEQEVVARFKALAGSCALMVVQDKEQADLWRLRSMAHHSSASNSSNSSNSSSSGGQQSVAASGRLQQQQQPGGNGSGDTTAAANNACVVVDSAGAADGSANAVDNWRSNVEGITSSPEFEYTCLAGTLMQWDIERFTRIVANDFETGQPLKPVPPSYWLKIGQKLQLTKAQLATFRGLKELLGTAMSKMFDNLEQTTKQQHDMIQQQEVQLQLEQLQMSNSSCSSSGNRVIGDTGALQQAQAEAVSVQSSVLKRWHIFWTHMGIVVLNTLTPYQIATLIAVAYPGIMRIDSAVLDHLDVLEQHCEQEQQQQ